MLQSTSGSFIVAYPSRICIGQRREVIKMYKNKDGIVLDLFQAYLVEGASFTANEE